MSKQLKQSCNQDLSKDFIEAMSKSISQVTVVATQGIAGRFGMTVSAFSSVSAEPPLVLVCINRRSPVVEAIQTNKCFSVNLLQESQIEVADCFAGRSKKNNAFDFSCAKWLEAVTGAPLLVSASASFDCTLDSFHNMGTHCICIGQVQNVMQSDQSPLAFFNRTYQKLSQSQKLPSREVN